MYSAWERAKDRHFLMKVKGSGTLSKTKSPLTMVILGTCTVNSMGHFALIEMHQP